MINVVKGSQRRQRFERQFSGALVLPLSISHVARELAARETIAVVR